MKGFLLVFITSLYVSTLCNATAENENNEDGILMKFATMLKEPAKNMTLQESWLNFESIIKEITNSAIKTALPILMDSFMAMNLSTDCMRNTMNIIVGLKGIKPWAMRFLDSSGKIMDGILGGTLTTFGAYDQCIDTVVTSTRSRDKGKVKYRGQYCMINMSPPMPAKTDFFALHDVLEELKNISERDTVVGEVAKSANLFHFLTMRLAVCIPTGCTLADVDKVAKLVGKILSVNATASRCEVKEENVYTTIIIVALSCVGFFTFLVLVGFLIDVYAYYRKITFKNLFIRILLAFSCFTNFRRFANTNSASDTLSCLNGIRFFCMSWVILGHSYFTVNFQMFTGLEKVRAYAKDFFFQAVVNASVAVDTFFFIGALLVGFLTIKLVRNQGRKFNVGFYIFHRLWRILPTYSFVILLVFLGNLVGSGPLWHDTTYKHIKACYDNWWTNIIFINNFYDAEHMCIPTSWYIASDVQLYIGALIILLPLIRWPKAGICLSVLAVIVCVLYSGIGTYVNEYPPTMLFSNPDPNQRVEYWAKFYFRPFVHVGPYCIGLLAGYLLATKPDLKIPGIIQIMGWIVAFIANMSILYGVLDWNAGQKPPILASSIYASLNRTVWSMGIAWMVICCATGHGGFINYILSWKVFVPLGRLTYVAYLIHPLVQIVIIGNIKTQIQPDHFLAVWLFFGHLCVTYGIAFVGTMLIESPFMSIEKIFLPRLQRQKVTTPSLKESNINGSLKRDKNGDIASIVTTDEESGGIDNKCVIYKL